MSVTVPKYQEIAADFAEKLVKGEYAPGDRVYARSTLASTYGVSAETARRAVAVLADLGVLEVSGGSGAVILSIDKAVEFLRSFRSTASAASLKEELLSGIGRQKQELDRLAECVEELSRRSERLRAANPFVPFRISVTGTCQLLGRTLGETNFWHHTGATVVAVRSGEQTVLSPGPHAEIEKDCTLYYVGSPDCPARVRAYLYPAET